MLTLQHCFIADYQRVSSATTASTNSKSVQTSPEVEVDERKEVIRVLMRKEQDMRQYIQLLQRELEKRSNEATVSATRLRELESQLAEIRSSEITESSPTSAPLQQQQQLDEDEPEHKSENFLVLMLFVFR